MQTSTSIPRVTAWTVWVIASIFYAYQYILRVLPNHILDDIMQQFHMDASMLGQLSGVYYLGYALMHIPVGILLDRYGPKKVMTICILLTVAGLAPLIFAEHWIYPIIGRFLVGLGSSAAILGIFKIIRMTFSEALFPRMLSLAVTVGLLGAIYGGAPVGYMQAAFGYHTLLYVFAIGGIFLAALTYYLVPNIKSAPSSTIYTSLKEVFSNKKVLCACMFAGMMVGPLEGFADAWGKLFLKQVYGFENTAAATIPSLIFVGMCFGAPILSMIADKLASHLLTIIGAGIVMATSFACLLLYPLSPTILTATFLIVGACCAYQILAVYKISTYTTADLAGLTTAVANMIIMIFGYAFHTLIGAIVQHMGGPHTSAALLWGIAVIPIALLLGSGGFTLLLLREKKQHRYT